MLKLFFKKWFTIFVIIVASLIIGSRTAVSFFHFFFWFLVTTVAINIIWILITYFTVSLCLVRDSIEKMEEDDVLEIEISITNNSPLPVFNIVLEDNASCAVPDDRKRIFLIEHLERESSLGLRYNCACPLRGKYRLGPFVVYFFDPLGLFFLKKTYYVHSQVYVYPHSFNIKRFPDLVKGVLPWFGIDTARVSADQDEFFGVREYKEGDPIKRIHWVSTARKNSLIVKQYQRQSFCRATIVFNLNKSTNFGEGKESVAEYIIKIAASVSKYLLERDISVEIIAHAGEMVHMPFNKGPEHLDDIMKFLSVARPESQVSLNDIFQEFSRYIPNDSSIIAIMLDTDQEYLPPILLSERRNISVLPLVIISSTFSQRLENQNILKEMSVKKFPAHNLNPLFFSRGDHLEECFTRY